LSLFFSSVVYLKPASDLRQVCDFLKVLRFNSTNKTDFNDTTEILLKVALNTITTFKYSTFSIPYYKTTLLYYSGIVRSVTSLHGDNAVVFYSQRIWNCCLMREVDFGGSGLIRRVMTVFLHNGFFSIIHETWLILFIFIYLNIKSLWIDTSGISFQINIPVHVYI
jgi:hypothetical protein